MKATLSKKSKFRPISIKLIIESEEELCDLWHRTNVSQIKLQEIIEDYLKHGCDGTSSNKLFDILDGEVERLKLTK